MQEILKNFEKKLEQILEDPISNLLDSRIKPAALADSILDALEANLHEGKDQPPSIPDHYNLFLSPDTFTLFSVHEEEIRSSLSDWVLENAQRRNYYAPDNIVILFEADPTLSGDTIVIAASHSHILDTTHSLASSPPTLSFPEGAYLILNDTHIPVNKPILNIGRRRDNQIVLNERSVSRTHAQIRARDHHFLVIDLGSTTGTFINGNQIHQAILHSGDVITIGGQRLIYFEEDPSYSDETSAFRRSTPEAGIERID
ncbi:MAG: DUF3662 domain-containing protein [Anaerolineales bacterium]|nr:DUF3662 domain-containing protein [Anaerolineales bacterium]